MLNNYLNNTDVTSEILKIISSITPYDQLELEQISGTVEWINSGAPLFRIKKPDIPNKHLVSYFVLFDENNKSVLLVDHKKALLWLPSGGHVELNENPKDTVKRECVEELGVELDFWAPEPLFLSSTVTVGLTAGHCDVSLWYVLKGDSKDTYSFDKEEFNSIKWFSLEDIPYDRTDPHMKRFVEKLKMSLSK